MERSLSATLSSDTIRRRRVSCSEAMARTRSSWRDLLRIGYRAWFRGSNRASSLHLYGLLNISLHPQKRRTTQVLSILSSFDLGDMSLLERLMRREGTRKRSRRVSQIQFGKLREGCIRVARTSICCTRREKDLTTLMLERQGKNKGKRKSSRFGGRANSFGHP